MGYKPLRKEDVLTKIEEMLENIKDQYSTGVITFEKPVSRNVKTGIMENNIIKFTGKERKINTKSQKGLTYIYRLVQVLKLSRELIKNRKSITIRDLYYISSNWGDDKAFASQSSARQFLLDLEVLLGVPHEALSFYVEEQKDQTRIMGNVIAKYRDLKGREKVINFNEHDYGSLLPVNFLYLDEVEFKIDAEFVLAIETGGIFRRLVEEEYHKKRNCILVLTSGQPSRTTRRLIKKFNEEYGLPVYVFTDGDCYGWLISMVIKHGSFTLSHISELLACPKAEFIGVSTDDIINYKLPGEKLTKHEVNKLKAMLNDPRFSSHWWQKQIKEMLKLKRSAEQQSLVKYGLDFVVKYLDEKIGG